MKRTPIQKTIHVLFSLLWMFSLMPRSQAESGQERFLDPNRSLENVIPHNLPQRSIKKKGSKTAIIAVFSVLGGVVLGGTLTFFITPKKSSQDSQNQGNKGSSKKGIEDLLKNENFDLEGMCNNNGETFLHAAAYFNYPEAVKLLIEKGIYINKKTKYGRTALHYAAENGSKEVVQLLIDKKAWLNQGDNRGTTPFDIAREKGHVEIANLLEKAQEALKKEIRSSTELTKLGESVKKETGQELFESAWDINKLLYWAVKYKNTEIVELTIRAGAYTGTEKDGYTPLLLAISQHKASEEISTADKSSGLDFNYKEIIKMLAKSTDLDKESKIIGKKEKVTALRLAQIQNKKEIVKILLDAGANPNKIDSAGKRPLDYEESRFTSIGCMLTKAGGVRTEK